MKSKLCVIWVLGALMVMAFLDAVPNPPAVNRHTGNVIHRPYEARGALCERRLSCDFSCTSPHLLKIRWIAFTSVYEPNLPGDCFAQTVQATDPSPPAIETLHKLYLQS